MSDAPYRSEREGVFDEYVDDGHEPARAALFEISAPPDPEVSAFYIAALETHRDRIFLHFGAEDPVGGGKIQTDIVDELLRLAKLGLEAGRRTADLTGEAMREVIDYLHKHDGVRSLRVRVFDGEIKLSIENGSAEPVAESRGSLFHDAVATLKDDW